MAWNPAKPPRITWTNQQTTSLLEKIHRDTTLRRAFYPRPGEPRPSTQRRYELSRSLTETILAGSDYVRWLAYMTPSGDVPAYLRVKNTAVTLPIAGRLTRLKKQAAPVLIKIGHKYRSEAELPPKSEALRIWKDVQPHMPWLFVLAALLAGEDPQRSPTPALVRTPAARSVAPPIPTPAPSISTVASGSKRSRADSTSSASSSSSSSSCSTTTTASSSSSDGIEIIEKLPASVRKPTPKKTTSSRKSASSSPVKRPAKRTRIIYSSRSSSSDSETSSSSSSAPQTLQWSSGMFDIIELDSPPPRISTSLPTNDVGEAVEAIPISRSSKQQDLASEESDSEASVSACSSSNGQHNREEICESEASDDEMGSDSDSSGSCSPVEEQKTGDVSQSSESDTNGHEETLDIRPGSFHARGRPPSLVPDAGSKAYKAMAAEAEIEARSRSMSELSKYCRRWGHIIGSDLTPQRKTSYTAAKRAMGKSLCKAAPGVPIYLREKEAMLAGLRTQADQGLPLNYSEFLKKPCPHPHLRRAAASTALNIVEMERDAKVIAPAVHAFLKGKAKRKANAGILQDGDHTAPRPITFLQYCVLLEWKRRGERD